MTKTATKAEFSWVHSHKQDGLPFSASGSQVFFHVANDLDDEFDLSTSSGIHQTADCLIYPNVALCSLELFWSLSITGYNFPLFLQSHHEAHVNDASF